MLGLQWVYRLLASILLYLPSTLDKTASHSFPGCPSSRCTWKRKTNKRRFEKLSHILENKPVSMFFTDLSNNLLTSARDRSFSWDYSESASPEDLESLLLEAIDHVSPKSVAPVEWRPFPEKKQTKKIHVSRGGLQVPKWDTTLTHPVILMLLCSVANMGPIWAAMLLC